MKLLAILNRGYKRDFIDVAAMLGSGLPLQQLIAWAQADIPGLTIESVLRSLAWRGDAETQPEPDGIDSAGWAATTRAIDAAIKALVRSADAGSQDRGLQPASSPPPQESSTTDHQTPGRPSP